MSDDFYRAFEERYRGSRELIKARLRVYLPFVEPLLAAYAGEKNIDLGCGRGEWLELLRESGFEGYGVDLDDEMLSACRERNLTVMTGDAISTLKSQPDDSHAIVSGFHIVEHISFADLQLLVKEALRVLKPGGLLILETPNPENLVVGSANFYLDPTHNRPIPSQLLSFLPEYYGFSRMKIVRLQESAALTGTAPISLLNVLDGVSPDYAVIAQKAGDAALMEQTGAAFANEYGLGLRTLAERFEQQLISAGERASAIAQQVQLAIQHAESAEHQAQLAIQHAANATAALNAIYHSSSWRTTAPVRIVGRKVKSLLSFVKGAEPGREARVQILTTHARLYINRRPWLRRLILNTLSRFPTLHARIIAMRTRRMNPPSVATTDVASLTPHARRIHASLVEKINGRSKGGD